jgi:hypothetical protein
VIGHGYDVGFQETGDHFSEIYANNIRLRINIVDLVIYHVWVILIIDEADFGVLAEFGAIHEVFVCFEECGAFWFDDFAIHHKRGNDVVENGITEFGIEIVADRENPVFWTIVICVNHDFVDVALFLFDSQVFKNSYDVWTKEFGINVEKPEKCGFFVFVYDMMREILEK